MRGTYISIALLVLYGDLVKRYLPPQVSLWVLYGMAVAILIAMIMDRKKYSVHLSLNKAGSVINRLAIFLIIVYLFQVGTSFTSPFMEGLTHAVYISVPLLYIVVIQRYCPQFDLTRMGNIFLWLMLPANCVGWIQYFVMPDFLISTTYSGAHGGAILRNLLHGGTFVRFPSIFASADRYSAMALMQLYFTFFLFFSLDKGSWRRLFWVVFNFFSASSAIVISGARSRILIAAAALALMAITFTLRAFLSSRKRHVRLLGRALPILGVMLMIGYLLVGVFHQELGREGEAFPVLTFLRQSLEEGDIRGRVGEAATFSLIPEEITLLGEGLGTVGQGGKPGEFGIRSMWIESGLIWGSLLLLAFMGIVVILLKLTCSAFLSKKWIEVAVYSVPLLLMIFSLLAGLTSAFELSSGILLGCSIAVITRSSLHVTGSPPPLGVHPIGPRRPYKNRRP